MKILIVDDYASIRETLRLVLCKRHEILEASDGYKALEVLSKEKVTTVLLDYNMPGMNGLLTLQEIRKRYPGINVILMSAEADRGLITTALANGAYGFIDKPVDFAELFGLLDELELECI